MTFNPKKDLKKSQNLPDFPVEYEPEIIEFFDREGLLMSQNPYRSFDCPRPPGFEAEYLAIYVDGELGFFQENERILLNRGIENLLGS